MGEVSIGCAAMGCSAAELTGLWRGGRSGRGQRPQTEVVAAGGALMAAAAADPRVASRRITDHGQDVLLGLARGGKQPSTAAQNNTNSINSAFVQPTSPPFNCVIYLFPTRWACSDSEPQLQLPRPVSDGNLLAVEIFIFFEISKLG